MYPQQNDSQAGHAYAYPYGYAPPPVAPAERSSRRTALVAGTTALVAGCAVAAAVIAASPGVLNGSGTALAAPSVDRRGTSGGGSGGGTGTGTSAGTSSGTATSAQSAGVVDINTVLAYEGAAAAGTGMIVTSSGEVLTNNHVVQGATSIKVTVVTTGRSYTARVVGTDATDDVAVLQLSGASGLRTAAFGDSTSVSVGAAVTGVGNAGGAGGTPSSATGQVVALDQQLTASDETGQNAETLTGMIEINAPIASGDSGGPLYNTSGKIIGMDTAAATNGRTTVAAYAIPINKALTIAGQIESGSSSATVQIGGTGFLGVSVADSTGGALVEQVVNGGPAAGAGVTAGDVITAVGGTRVDSGTALKSALASTRPGQSVRLTWTDTRGSSHGASVTLVAGPAA